MRRTVLWLYLIALIGGCADSGTEVETATGNRPAANATVETQQPTGQDVASEPESETAVAAPPVDAEQLLATTLATAKADDKRVLVHLGAPW